MAKPKSQLKWKRKDWYEILAPDLFNNQKIGETPAVEKENIIGRTISKSVNRLLGDESRRYMKLKFKLTDVEDGKATTKIDGFKVSKNHISKVVQQGTTRIDIVEGLETKDDVGIKVQLLILPSSKISKEKRKALVRKGKEELEKMVKGHNLQALFLMIISQDVQKKIRSILGKIYPIRYVEIKKVEPQ